MSTLTIASDPEEAAAAKAVEAHHAHLGGELAGYVHALLDAAMRDPAGAAAARSSLVAFCERELLPHASAEEETLYPAARAKPEARLLVDSMVGEHRRMRLLINAIGDANSDTRAAAEARALQVLFEVHLTKENTHLLPLLAGATDVRLAGLLAGMHEILGDAGRAAEQTKPKRGGCRCGHSDEPAVPEFDVRSVPHVLRHAAVFGALTAVREGHAMVIVAPHDPLPLLAQIEKRNPGDFVVEYLERGPAAWRIQLTRR